MSGTRPPRWDRFRALLALGGVLGLGAVGTLAAWTDTSTVTSGTFSTGRIDLRVGNPPVNDNPPAFATTFAATGLKPGDSVTAPLLVTNAGTVPFTYRITGTATNNGGGADQLGAAMTVQVYPNATCSGSTVLNSPERFTFGATAPRPLAVGTDETLCLRAALPTDAASDLQSTNTVATFTLTATSS